MSHELKTPVAVVRSSLENLAHSGSEQERQQYLERASGATERLRRILNSMSEAARLSRALTRPTRSCLIWPALPGKPPRPTSNWTLSTGLTIKARSPIAPPWVRPKCSCRCSINWSITLAILPRRAAVEVELQAKADHYQLSVFNEGSQLPGNTGVDIFGAFVSQREGQSEGHLGQGLLIVRLIADYHGGYVDAENKREGRIDGVCFRVIIPMTDVEPGTLS